MNFTLPLALAALLLSTTATTAPAPAARQAKAQAKKPPRTEAKTSGKADSDKLFKGFFQPSEVRSSGTMTISGQSVAYDSIAGTLVIHPKEWEDTDATESEADKSSDKDKNTPKPEASMFYTAYFKQGVPAAGRPITFLFNGGPGSSTVWLRMGAFGPVRVVTTDGRHTPAPYSVIANDQSLLDVSDLV